VMVAFVVFVTWSGYADATKNLQMEANQVADIFHSAEAFPDPARKAMKHALTNYVTSVCDDELQRMSQGDIALHSSSALPRLMAIFYQMDERSVPNRELYAETLKRLNDLAQYRRLRIFAGNDTVPWAVWFVLLIGGVFAVSYLLTTTLTVMITQILFLIYVLDHPFAGTSKVSADPLKEVMAIMQQGKE